MLLVRKPALTRQAQGFEGMVISQFTWSPNGKNLVYNRGAIMRDIILLENTK
jgi:hypothetical protein